MIEKETLIKNLVSAGVCASSDIRGATEDEVVALEKWFGAKMPEQYREFLLAIGHGAGCLFQGTDIFISSVARLKEEAIALLEESREDVELGEEIFVFSMHQGYEFTYFSMSEGSDPPVYQYVEGNGPPVLTWTSFSEFLSTSIGQHEHVRSPPPM